MIVYGKPVIAFYIICEKDSFICDVKNTENNHKIRYEISKDKNDFIKLMQCFLCDDFIFCGYGNNHYSNALINYMFAFFNIFKESEYNTICSFVYDIYSDILKDGESWLAYKYGKNFKSFDIKTMMFSKKDELSLREASIKYNLQLSDYVDNIAYMININEEQIRLREAISNGLFILSYNNVKLGEYLLKKEYIKATNVNINDIKPPQRVSHINFSDIILNEICFETKELKELLNKINSVSINSESNWNETILIKDLKINLGLGGLHSVEDKNIFTANESEIILNIDVTSLFPTVLTEYKLYPRHLQKEFLSIYRKFKNKRVSAKKVKDKIKSACYKHALNSAIGLMQKEGMWLYDYTNAVSIRINSELLMLMLIEKLSNSGFDLFNCNTDGFFVKVTNEELPKLSSIIKSFEEKYRLKFEYNSYNKLIQYTINDYIAIGTNNKITGIFNNSSRCDIIGDAVKEYFINNIPIETTITNCKDIFKFTTYQKVSRDFIVSYGDKLLKDKTNRFYYSIGGSNLVKYKINADGNKSAEVKINDVDCVTLLNDKIETTNPINYQYYIGKANKIINELQNKQLTLF